MPEFVEFSREDSRSRREDPQFTWQARGLLSLNLAAFRALGEPEAVILLYDANDGIVALRKVDPAHPNAYNVRKQKKSQSYVVGAQGFAAYHGIQTLTARRFVGHYYEEEGVWGFALREGVAVKNRRGARDQGPANTTRWRHTTDGFEVAPLMRIGHVGMSHPGYMRPPQDMPSRIRIGMLVACDPLGSQPSTSELRARFLDFLTSPPLMDLINVISHVDREASWTRWAGHGRFNFEAALITRSGDLAEAPVASALMLLPETGTTSFGRDPRFAELVLDIEPRSADGKPVPPVTLHAWHDRFVRGLKLPDVFAHFLEDQLGLQTRADPSAQAGVWLKTQHTMTDLVDVGDLTSLPGSPTSNQFIGYLIADVNGQSIPSAAAELLRQMCDYTLHVDEYEPLLATLNNG